MSNRAAPRLPRQRGAPFGGEKLFEAEQSAALPTQLIENDILYTIGGLRSVSISGCSVSKLEIDMMQGALRRPNSH